MIDRTLPKRRHTSAIVTKGQNEMTGVVCCHNILIVFFKKMSPQTLPKAVLHHGGRYT